MNPLIVSARYAAFVWFQSQDENAGKSHDDAHAFARNNWERFLPVANKGWGRLLLKIARKQRKRATAKVAARAVALPEPQAVEVTQDTSSFFGYTWTGNDM